MSICNKFNCLLARAIFVAALAWLAFVAVTAALADDLHIPCPTPEPCKVLFLSPQEEALLTGKNGILDTAAQGRALELGQFVVYLKTRIQAAPSGETKPVAAPDKPVDSK